MPESQLVDVAPIAATDSLLARLLSTAVESYIAGDYHAALARLKDARAIGRARTDMVPIHAFEAALESALDLGVICALDGAPAVRG